jgi:hypothetical protein
MALAVFACEAVTTVVPEANGMTLKLLCHANLGVFYSLLLITLEQVVIHSFSPSPTLC